MTPVSPLVTPAHPTITQQPWHWKMGLAYDVLMMILIVCNLLALGMQAIILSDFGNWIAQWMGWQGMRAQFIQQVNPVILRIDHWFVSYLVAELVVRWIIAAVSRQYTRWWFFPFVHWYEVLAIIPVLRVLRLLRAVVIGYQLYQLGYRLIPASWLRLGRFYYDVVMEEITDRVVLTGIRQVEKELEASQTMHGLLHGIIEHHRVLFAQALADQLQQTLPRLIQQHQPAIAAHVGQAVAGSLARTPELHQLLRLIPLVGGRLEHHLQDIAQHLGQHVTQALLAPLQQPADAQQLANPVIRQLAEDVSHISLDSPYVERLVDSVLRESLQALRQQVAIQQWKVALEQKGDHPT